MRRVGVVERAVGIGVLLPVGDDDLEVGLFEVLGRVGEQVGELAESTTAPRVRPDLGERVDAAGGDPSGEPGLAEGRHGVDQARSADEPERLHAGQSERTTQIALDRPVPIAVADPLDLGDCHGCRRPCLELAMLQLECPQFVVELVSRHRHIGVDHVGEGSVWRSLRRVGG